MARRTIRRGVAAVLVLGLVAIVSSDMRTRLPGIDGMNEGAGSGPTGVPGKWRLVFHDDFEDDLDSKKWNLCYPTDVIGCTNAGNGELQWYLPANVEVHKGVLSLTARREPALGADGEVFEYTSGMVTTGPATYEPEPAKFGFTYGFVEARVKIPRGAGLWPALWLLPEDQDWPPEIDVLEVLSHDPFTVHLNNHWKTASGPEKSEGSFTGPDFSADYHLFGVGWSPNSIDWYVDGVLRRQFSDRANIPDQPMYVLANLAVGGEWPGAPDDMTVFPARYDLDFVRIWQKKS